MSRPNDGGRAFPVVTDNEDMVASDGLSIRDYFAAAALTAIAHDNHPEEAAQLAYRYADAMLRARREPQA
jgi:hypothetical protein